jgi:vacuolar-type H+-ATPase subunit E/Vma4
MSLDAIRKSILSDAEAKASAVDSEAAAESKRILQEAEEKAKSILKAAEHAAQAEAERRRSEARAGAETEANSIILGARGDAVERELKRVTARAEALLSRDYPRKLFDSGLKQFKDIADSGFTIKTSKKNAGVLKGGKYNVEYADIDGFVFSTDDGTVSLNATAQSILEREKDFARGLVSSDLYGRPKASRAAPRPGKKTLRPKKVTKRRG